ncbi:PHP domain-containing protein [Clostridium butyricum]|uniref:PHP domain-containing protein n=1 Tax=Clostridium butyricum TaxID=1492 RepID=UPI0013D215D6|nr:PHP domain-containing protein [Clostridium butyricum]MCQ2023682.1 PHP domain-containing protein [Clostridium butyricum]NFB70717.1 PHP domain-containing protein [Clostridium butyricum]NFB92225.1 PHP domain-containing protein [Clostridium butyricum]
MKNNFIDMHMHSFYSDDGEFTPSELVKKCHESGVRIMAIADHNTVKAIDEAIKEAQKYNINYIPAIEIDCTYKGINLHVLGYGIDYKNDIFNKLEETVSFIKNSGGIAVLAHPGNNLKGCFDIFDEMIDAGIEGVEAFSSYHDDTAIQYFLDKGMNSNLLITCGSDYHGKTKPAIQIGKTGCFVDETEIEKHLKKVGLI